MKFDEWDCQPTIRVVVKRKCGGEGDWRVHSELEENNGEPESGLLPEAGIELNPQEWAAVIEQLQGPLKILMERKPWHYDTT
jgi:hypothetical protein